MALTRKGTETAVRIAKQLKSDVFIKEEFLSYGKGLLEAGCVRVEEKRIRAEGVDMSQANEDIGSNQAISIEGIPQGFKEFVGKLFGRYDGIIFVMACGIVVRSIAPYIQSKKSDPAVVVLDEKGMNVISLLSGHIGGANTLTYQVAGITGGNPVVTTATDINEIVSLDVFAKNNGLKIESFELLKSISGHLVNGGKIGLYSDYSVKYELNEDGFYKHPEYIGVVFTQKTKEIIIKEQDSLEYWVALTNKEYLEILNKEILYIRPKNLVIGIGCKRNTPAEQIHKAVSDFLKEAQRSIASVKNMATIDIKMREEGIVEFCNSNKIELVEVSKERIKSVERNYACSDYVRKIVGVGCVAEPCAVLAGKGAELIVKKKVYSGITLALAEDRVNELYLSNKHWYISETGRKL